MAFARSASGPAGLSINTGAANLFGSPASQPQAPAAGSVFNSTAPTLVNAQSFFGNPAASQPAPTNSIFGAPANTAQPQQQQQQQQIGGGGGTLFGSNMAAAKPGGLFGGLTTNTNTAGGGSSIFGGGASTATAQQPQQPGASLFGAPQSAAPAAGGGLFGQTQQQQQPKQSLFGGASTLNTQPAANTAVTGGLFGQKPATPAGGSLFGAAKPPMAQSVAAPALGSTMGPQQVIPGVRIDLSNLRNTTRFNDLQEDLQKEIASIDKQIQNCMEQKDQVDAFMPQHEVQLENIPGDVRFVSRKYAAVDSALGTDLHAIKQMRDQARLDWAEATLSVNAANNLSLPEQYHVTPSYYGSSTRAAQGQQQQSSSGNGNTDGSGSTSEDLVSYFSRATDEMDEQIKKLQRTVREIDTHLGGVEQNLQEHASRLQASNGSLGAGSQDDRLMELYQVLGDFENGIFQVAAVVGGAREGLTELQMRDFRGRGAF